MEATTRWQVPPKLGPGSGDAQLKDDTVQDRNENEKYCAKQQGIKFLYLKNLHSLLFVQTLLSSKTLVLKPAIQLTSSPCAVN